MLVGCRTGCALARLVSVGAAYTVWRQSGRRVGAILLNKAAA